jgi:hypothetical protein
MEADQNTESEGDFLSSPGAELHRVGMLEIVMDPRLARMRKHSSKKSNVKEILIGQILYPFGIHQFKMPDCSETV